MGFLKLNVYGYPSTAVFDPDAVLQKVKEEFPEATVSPEDQLTVAAEWAEVQGAAGHVVETLRRNAQSHGPAYTFAIPIADGGVLQGRARRYDVTFLFDEPLPEDLRRRCLAFLRSFGVGRLEASTETKRVEILFDLGKQSPDGAESARNLPQVQKK